jgi:hypothetical protein
VRGDLDFSVECCAQVRGRHDLLRRAHRHGAAVAQEEDAGCQARRLVQVVHRDQRGDAVADREIADQRGQRETMANVEERSRFVQEENARLLGEGSGKCHAALLAAAQRVDPAVCVGDEIAPGQGALHGGSIGIALTHPPALVRRAAHGDHLANAKPRCDRVALRHDCNVASQRAPLELHHVSPEASHLPSCRREEARRHP